LQRWRWLDPRPTCNISSHRSATPDNKTWLSEQLFCLWLKKEGNVHGFDSKLLYSVSRFPKRSISVHRQLAHATYICLFILIHAGQTRLPTINRCVCRLSNRSSGSQFLEWPLKITQGHRNPCIFQDEASLGTRIGIAERNRIISAFITKTFYYFGASLLTLSRRSVYSISIYVYTAAQVSTFSVQVYLQWVCRSAYYHVPCDRLDQQCNRCWADAAKALVQAYIPSRLDYCNSVLYAWRHRQPHSTSTINQVDPEDMSESTHHTRFAEIALAGVQCQTEFKLILSYTVTFRPINRPYTVALTLQCCARLSIVCNVDLCIVAKRCVLPKICLKKQIGNGLSGIEWSRNWWRHMTWRVKVVTPICFEPNIWRSAGDAVWQNNRSAVRQLMAARASRLSYSDSLASCLVAYPTQSVGASFICWTDYVNNKSQVQYVSIMQFVQLRCS